MTVEQLKEQVNMLSPEERAALALHLLRSLDGEDEVDQHEIDAAWREEITRRVTEIKSGRAVGIPSEEVHAQLREKLR
jgi:putative addiction module component (TIGR02574 family)